MSVQRLDTLGPVYAMLRPSALARRAFLLGLEPYRHRLPYLPATVLLDLTQLYAVMAGADVHYKQSCAARYAEIVVARRRAAALCTMDGNAQGGNRHTDELLKRPQVPLQPPPRSPTQAPTPASLPQPSAQPQA